VRVKTLSQVMKSPEDNIAAVTVGNDELSSLRTFSVLGGKMFRETVSGLISYEDFVRT